MSGPYAVVLRYRGPGRVPTPAELHAAFLATVRRADPALASALHNPALGLRPFTLAPVGNPATGRLGVRLSVLDPEVFRRFWDRWNRRGGLPLTFGRRRWAPEAVEEGGAWAGRAEWGALLGGEERREVRLLWCTPTAFRQGDVDLPLPLPRLVFGGLLEKWNRFSPHPLKWEAPALERHLVVSGHRLATRAFDDGRASIPGFVGWTEFRLLRGAGEEERRAFSALVRFAFYAGVGRKTTHGMGLVRVVG